MVIYREIYKVKRGDFATAGEASAKIKSTLKKMGIGPAIIREVAISSYELELNLVIHSMGGELILEIENGKMSLISKDIGPGIADKALVMQEGYSTAPESVRAMGFGAGMGLPNMKKYTDRLQIDTVLGVGTTLTMRIDLH